jgi:hypothetical protein
MMWSDSGQSRIGQKHLLSRGNTPKISWFGTFLNEISTLTPSQY